MRRLATQHWLCPDHVREIALDRYVRLQMGGLSWRQARDLILSGKLTVNGQVIRTVTARIQAGDEIEFTPSAPDTESARRRRIAILYRDSQIILVEKPAGISTVPYDEDERDTLLDRVRRTLRAERGSGHPTLHVVHRIDKPTSGIVVFARTHAAWTRLKQTFRIHDIERRYLALVHGNPGNRTFRSQLVADRGDGKRGSTFNPKLGRCAVTHVQVLEALQSATLIQCSLETGRTHQIRIQLAEAGHPLLGERVYGHGMRQGLDVPRLMLHASRLAFRHPLSGIRLDYTSALPSDMSETVERLRRP